MKILVVDDEVEVVNFLCVFLERLGLNAEKATCGREALEVCSREKPEWVFLDIKMSDMDGLEVLKKMKEAVRSSFGGTTWMSSATTEVMQASPKSPPKIAVIRGDRCAATALRGG